MTNRRKLQPSLLFQSLQQQAAFVILHFPVDALPLQQLTHGAGNLGPSQCGEIRADLLDELQFRLEKSAAMEGETFRDLRFAVLSRSAHQPKVSKLCMFVQQNYK